jgi:hypothetical protein
LAVSLVTRQTFAGALALLQILELRARLIATGRSPAPGRDSAVLRHVVEGDFRLRGLSDIDCAAAASRVFRRLELLTDLAAQMDHGLVGTDRLRTLNTVSSFDPRIASAHNVMRRFIHEG